MPASPPPPAAVRGALAFLALLAFLLLLPFLAVTGCGRQEGEEPESGRPMVVVSVAPQAFFVERLAGDRVDIMVLIPPGASPATHEPSMSELGAMERARLFVKVGHPNFPFERSWLDRLLRESGPVRVVDCAEGLPVHAEDPHIWVGVTATRHALPRIATALIELLPEARSEIEARLSRLIAEIDAVDLEIRAALAGIDQRRFYVFHAAWGYFAADYGLEQVPIEIGHKEPDPHRLATIIDRARADGVRVIFVQPQFSRRSAEVIAGEIGGRVVPLDPLARDWLGNLRDVAAAFRTALEASGS